MRKYYYSIYKKLRNTRIESLKNESHKKQLRDYIIKRSKEQTPVDKMPVVFKYALPAAALIIMATGLIIVLQLTSRISSPVATATPVQGDVLVKTNVYNIPQKIESKNELKNGMIIQTKENSTVDINLGKKTTLVMKELSEIEIMELNYTNQVEENKIYMQRGEIICNVESPGLQSNFAVYTDTTLIQVIGTKIRVSIKENQDMLIDVIEGSVYIDNFYKVKNNLKQQNIELMDIKSTLESGRKKLKTDDSLLFDYSRLLELNKRLQSLLERINQEKAEQKQKEELAIIKNEMLSLLSEDTPPENKPLKNDDTAEEIVTIEDDDEAREQEENIAQRKPGRTIIPINGSVEEGILEPSGWSASENMEFFKWTSTDSYDGQMSLKISLDKKHDKPFFWTYTINTDIPVGKNLTFKIYIKAEKIFGNGCCLALKADKEMKPTGEAELYFSTQDRIIIQGTMDWTEYTLDMDEELSENIKSITIYLMLLPETEGTVLFDNMFLTFE